MAPALTQIGSDLNMNPVEQQMALSVYVLAIAFGPLIIGPVSEVYGRLPTVHGFNLWFLLWNLVCGFSNTKGLLIAAQFLAGIGGSLDYAISIPVLGDTWGAEERGLSLGLYNFVPLLGTVAGPIVGGFVAQAIGWRWLFWIVSIAQGAVMLVSLFSFRETHEATLLRKRAAKLRKTTGNQQLYTSVEQHKREENIANALVRSLTRPLRLLFTHPIIQVLSLIFAFNFVVLFFVISTFSEVWIADYHESVSISGLNYIAWVVGELTGALVAAPVTDRVWAYLKKKASNEVTPEYRVPLMLPGAILVPTGLLIYGWAAQARTFWLVLDVGAAIIGCGLMSSTMSVNGYVIDAYPEHTASANAATQFLSSVFGFVFPLFAPQMYQVLGYGWGNSVLAFIAIFLGTIGPLVL